MKYTSQEATDPLAVPGNGEWKCEAEEVQTTSWEKQQKRKKLK
jgi:hypothetical protein